MLAFVDESGDPGRKLDAGSSSHFVVALVIFEEHEDAQAADQRINLLRHELHLDPRFEFRFNKSHPGIRKQFLRAVAPYNFFYYGIAVNKHPAKLYGEGFNHKESFYRYTSSLVFENAKGVLNDAIVVIDGSGSRDFRRQLQTYLKRKINDPKQRYIKHLKVEDSQGNNLLQLADMVAGAIYRSLGNKKDAKDYRRLIAHREISVRTWPK